MMPLAALTVMLWILWSDSVRPRKPSKLIYSIRVLLFLMVTGVIIYNLVEYPTAFTGAAAFFSWLAVGIGILGAGYFLRRVMAR